MIRIINDLSATAIRLRNSHYSRIILSHMQTYGTDYDFCEFYELKQRGKRAAVFSCFNGSVAGDIIEGADISRASFREVVEFIRFKSPYYAELPFELIGKSIIKGYHRAKRCFYEIPAAEDSEGIERCTDLEAAFKTAFAEKEASYGLWLTDTVRRSNKDLLRVYGYKSSVLTVRCRSSQMAYISDVATPAEERGRGYAAKLLGGVAAIMQSEGYTSYLCADESSWGYYEHLGYRQIFSDNIFKNKDSVLNNEHK